MERGEHKQALSRSVDAVEAIADAYVGLVEIIHKISGISLLVEGSAQRCSSGKLIAALGELAADVVILTAAGHMGVESAGCSVVDSHGGNDTHAVAGVEQFLCH